MAPVTQNADRDLFSGDGEVWQVLLLVFSTHSDLVCRQFQSRHCFIGWNGSNASNKRKAQGRGGLLKPIWIADEVPCLNDKQGGGISVAFHSEKLAVISLLMS